MSDLKTAAQQALEALEAIDEDPHGTHSFPALSNDAITALRAALAQQAEPTPPDATAGLVDDLCLLHMSWKADAEGDLYRAAWGRVIARAAEVRRLWLIKQLKAQVGKGEEP